MDTRHTRGPDLAHAFGRERPRPPYTEASLLEAIRTGRSSSGAMLDLLMPRYALGPEDGRLLVGYLRQLSTSPSPGVTPDVIHLATVIAPGVDPERRTALVDVLQGAVSLHNASVKLEQLRDRSSSGSAHARYRQWELALWDLTGPAASWDAQLAARYRRRPVFALLSGLSEGDWSPVERFAERMGIPVWFPTVDLPALGEGEFYSAYFTEGVKLEAAVLARQIRALGGLARVVQLHGPTTAEEGGARALGERLQGASLAVESRRVDPGQPGALRAALSSTRPEDVVVLWLRPGALRLLAGVPAPTGPVYASGLLGNGERAPFPADWKRSAHLVYPFELPERRRASAARFQAWMRARNLPVVDERVQGEAYLAAQLFSARVDELLESLQRDYLLERAESFLAERVSPVLFRSLQLGAGQRVASKGAYLVRFAGAEGTAVRADGEWIVP